MKDIPEKLIVSGGLEIDVIQKDLGFCKKGIKNLGTWDPKTITIYIDESQPAVSKWITLFHEGLHAMDDLLIVQGTKERAFTEKSIEFCATSMMLMLVANGLTDLVTYTEGLEYEDYLNGY